MFSAEIINREDRDKTLSQGKTFCQIGIPITFSIQDLEKKFPSIEIDFTIIRDDKKDKLITDKTELIDRKMSVKYYNPSIGTSGPINPVKLLSNEKYIVNLIYRVETLKNSDFCEFSYEFFLTNKNE